MGTINISYFSFSCQSDDAVIYHRLSFFHCCFIKSFEKTTSLKSQINLAQMFRKDQINAVKKG